MLSALWWCLDWVQSRLNGIPPATYPNNFIYATFGQQLYRSRVEATVAAHVAFSRRWIVWSEPANTFLKSFSDFGLLGTEEEKAKTPRFKSWTWQRCQTAAGLELFSRQRPWLFLWEVHSAVSCLFCLEFCVFLILLGVRESSNSVTISARNSELQTVSFFSPVFQLLNTGWYWFLRVTRKLHWWN